jgi:glycosyltransferase involved in cell wall biosynthesis
MNRILFTVDPNGAAWAFTSSLARAISLRGNEVVVASFGPEPSAERRQEMEQDGVKLTVIALAGPTTDPTFVAGARHALEMLVEELGPSVVQIDRCVFGDLDLEVPKVLTVAADRTLRVARGRGPARKGLLGADAVVSPTRALAEEISRRFEYRRPIAVIQPGAILGDAPVSVVPGKKRGSGVMFYGRTDEKADGFDVLLEASRRLGPEFPIRIAGEGNRPPLPEWVTDLGWLDANGRAAAFEKSEIVVLPSRDEPFGLLSAEAARTGCALLLSDVPTHHELWNGAATFVKPDDPAALAEALRSLVGDTRKREECSRMCRARALAGFGADRMVDEHLDVYRRIKRVWSKKAGGPPKLSEDVLPLG